MTTLSDDQRFLDLLQRWQSGDFTRQDEQLLRSLTESDDFRREAMEGFMALPEADHRVHLAALRERLRLPASPRSRVVPMPQLMAIAAALLVLVAAIWFFPRVTEKPLNSTSETAAPAQDATPQTAEPDARLSDVQAQSVPGMQRAERPSPAKSAEQPGRIVYQAPATEDRDLANSAKEESAPPAPVETATTAARPPATDAEPPGKPSAALGKAKTATKPVPTTPDTTDLAWNETEKKSDLTRLRQKARGPAQSEPAEGLAVFAEYLRQNARLPAEARDQNVSGTVRLQFTVNANGDPQNFVVLRSLGQSCDDEAKRLVQNWPWIRGQNPLVTVEIKFVR